MEEKKPRKKRSDAGTKRATYNLSEEGLAHRVEVKKTMHKELEATTSRTHALIRAQRQPKYTNGFLLALRLALYIYNERQAERPLTVAGSFLSAKLPKQSYYEYKNGKHDNLIDEVIHGARIDFQQDELATLYDKHKDNADVMNLYDELTEDKFEHNGGTYIYYSDVLERLDAILSAEREARLYEKGRVADIFVMKALDGWQEEDRPQAVHNTLVINGGTEEALKLLGYSKIE